MKLACRLARAPDVAAQSRKALQEGGAWHTVGGRDARMRIGHSIWR